VINGYKLPTDVKIRIRVKRPLAWMATAKAANYSTKELVYQFSTKGMAPIKEDLAVEKSAMDQINIVPNPYYAYSIYENSPLSNVVKITNLPNACTIKIFDVHGTLVRKLSKDIDEKTPAANGQIIDVSDGQSTEAQSENLHNAVNWDLKNNKGVPVASGMYYINIVSPTLGERTLKFFGVLRPTDVNNF
jgi:hypothetical protein